MREITLEQAKQLCIEAHAGQYRRPRDMTIDDEILFADKLEQLCEEDGYEVDEYVINGCRCNWNSTTHCWSIEEPYHVHPQAVSEMLSAEYRKILALLHDVIEDCDYTLDVVPLLSGNKYYIAHTEHPIQYEISYDLYTDLGLLTKDPNLTYRKNIRRIKNSGRADPIAVKIADNIDNLLTATDKQRQKYLTISLPILLGE